MNKKTRPPATTATGPSNILIWGVTLVAVLFILALAVLFSTKMRATPNDAVPPTASPHNSSTTSPPPVESANPAIPAAPRTAAPQPAISRPAAPLSATRDENTPATAGDTVLRLDRLAGTLKVKTDALLPNGRLRMDHSCYRDGTAPPASWDGAPRGTQSYVLLLEEHKSAAPPAAARPVIKWIVYNIPADKRSLPAALPQSRQFEDGTRQARNDHGMVGYVGPCVADEEVAYTLRLFALDTILTVPDDAQFTGMIPLMNGHIIDAAEQRFIFRR